MGALVAMASADRASDPAYPLVIDVQGVAVSDNRLKRRFTLMVNGKRYVITEYTDEAEAWMRAVRDAAAQAIEQLPSDALKPREWNLPLIFDVSWRRQRIDPLNGFKGLNDALAPALDVDDRFFEYDQITRQRIRGKSTVPGGPGVMIRVRPATEAEMIRPRPTKISPLRPGHAIQGGNATERPAAPRVMGITAIPDHLAAAIAEAEALGRAFGGRHGSPATRTDAHAPRAAQKKIARRVPPQRAT